MFDEYILYNIFNIDLTYETATKTNIAYAWRSTYICLCFSCYLYTWVHLWVFKKIVPILFVPSR